MEHKTKKTSEEIEKKKYDDPKEIQKRVFKNSVRSTALNYTPSSQRNSEGNITPLTATEKISEAEIIYQWLIKDI